MRPTRWIATTLLAATLVAALPIDAAARKPKPSIGAIVDGHRLKLRRKQLSDPTRTDAGGVAFAGGMQPRRLGQVLKSIAIGCALGLDSPVFPAAGQYCTIGYAETKFSTSLTIKQWAGGPDGVQVTFDSYDGTRLRGTFQGTLAPADPNAGYGPVTVVKGAFTVVFPQ